MTRSFFINKLHINKHILAHSFNDSFGADTKLFGFGVKNCGVRFPNGANIYTMLTKQDISTSQDISISGCDIKRHYNTRYFYLKIGTASYFNERGNRSSNISE